jgi:hypothetical protein
VSLEIRVRGDGTVAVDFHPPSGPYIVLSREQWRELVAEVRKVSWS